MLKLTKNEVHNMCIADQAAYINEVCASCGSDPYFYIDDWYNVYDVEDLTASGEPDEETDPIGDSDWMWEYILDLNYEGTGICGRVFATEDGLNPCDSKKNIKQDSSKKLLFSIPKSTYSRN